MKSKFFLCMIILVVAFSFAACGGKGSANIVDDLDRHTENSAVMDTNRGSKYFNDATDKGYSGGSGSFEDEGQTRLEKNRDHDGVVDHSEGSVVEDGGIQDM